MIVLKNLAESFITSAVDASATQITVPADHAGNFPNLLEGDNFRCALVNPATEAVEFINVTARDGNVLTVSRGEEGSAALPFPVESRIHLRMTARTWEEMAGECWMRPRDAAGEVVYPQYVSSTRFTLDGDFTDFFKLNRAVKSYPNLSVGFVESASFAEGVTTVDVIEMIVPADLTHVEAGLDPDALARRTLSNEELLGYMTPVPVLKLDAAEADGGTLVTGTISHPEVGKTYPDSTEFHFNLPEGVTDFTRSGLNFQMRMPEVTELESPKTVGPITCRAAQMSLILSDPSNSVSVSVRFVAVQAGVTLSYADSQAGYPGGDVTADGAALPAHTVGLDNISGKAIVSGTPEFEITGTEAEDLTNVSTTGFDTTTPLSVGMELETDQGRTVVESCTTRSEPQTTQSAPAVWYGDTDRLDSTTSSLISSITDAGCGSLVSVDSFSGECFIEFAAVNNGGSNEMEVGIVRADQIDALKFETCYNRANLQTSDAAVMMCSTGGAASTFHWTLYEQGQNTTGWSQTTTETLKLGRKADGTVYIKRGDIELKQVEAFTIPENVPVKFFVTFYGGTSTVEHILDDVSIAANQVISEATVTPSLPAVPTRVFVVPDIQIALGAGFTGEYLGQEVELTLNGTSTVSSLVFTSTESIKNKIFITGGRHNNLVCDGVNATVAGVSEVDNGDGTYTTTATLASALANVPTSVRIPDRCVVSVGIATCVISGAALKYFGVKIPFADPEVKRLALKFSGDTSLRVKAAKIYTEEGA